MSDFLDGLNYQPPISEHDFDKYRWKDLEGLAPIVVIDIITKQFKKIKKGVRSGFYSVTFSTPHLDRDIIISGEDDLEMTSNLIIFLRGVFTHDKMIADSKLEDIDSNFFQ